MSQEQRVHHEVTIDLSRVIESEDNVFPCQVAGCTEEIHLAYDGQSFSLYRQEDIDNVNYGTVGISFV